jgi:serine/threonine-protein kinase ATR
MKSHFCTACDADSDADSVIHKAPCPENYINELTRTLFKLIESGKFQESPKCRISGMLALRKLINHSSSSIDLSLAESRMGQWCLKCHSSSIRELRIAAGRTLPAFLCRSHTPAILHANRITALEFLRTLSEKEDLLIQETCLLSWCQVARVSEDDELNIVLFRLVQYLGHTNPFIHGLAYTEIQRISRLRNVTPITLLTPYWRDISLEVVKDLQTRPQIAQLLSDLLDIDIGQFLVLTQVYTLPFLVLCKKQDIIQRISQAREATGTNGQISEMLREHQTMAAVLALLLVQKSTDVEASTMSYLRAASSDFKRVDLADLVLAEPVLIASELLKAAGDHQERTRAKVSTCWRHLSQCLTN